jgi:sphinganine C4-monooxygenase
MGNQSFYDAMLPPLPSYTLTPRPDLIPWFSDVWMSVLLPVITYWIVSGIFHTIDVLDLFPQYRLHTPEEISSRNHVTRYDCLRDVIVQQIIQVVTGYLLTVSEGTQMIGKEDYDIAMWATRLRQAQRFLPSLLSLFGLNATAISKNMSVSHPFIAGALAGGHYPFLTGETAAPAFASWEMVVAKVIYHGIIPLVQFVVVVCLFDTWQYFIHRGMHMNKWLYSMTDHSPIVVAYQCLPSSSYHSFSPPPTLCALRLWCPIQPPSRGLPS